MIRVIELGPFGSRIDRGIIKNLDEIPKGFVIKTVDKKEFLSEVYIEPCLASIDRFESSTPFDRTNIVNKIIE